MKYSGDIRLINDKVKLYDINKESNILVLVGEHLFSKSLLLKSIRDLNKNTINYLPTFHFVVQVIEAYCEDKEIILTTFISDKLIPYILNIREILKDVE